MTKATIERIKFFISSTISINPHDTTNPAIQLTIEVGLSNRKTKIPTNKATETPFNTPTFRSKNDLNNYFILFQTKVRIIILFINLNITITEK